MIYMREVKRFYSVYDAVASQFSLAKPDIPQLLLDHYQEIGFFVEPGHFDGKVIEDQISPRLTSTDLIGHINNIAEYLSCIIIFLSSSCRSPTSIIPNCVKLPVPIFIGHVNLENTKFVSLEYNVPSDLCTCQRIPCSCKLVRENKCEESNEKSLVSFSICRCGVNKKKTLAKPSCLGSKRCPCFLNSSSCANCKCNGCENPFGRKLLDLETVGSKKKMTQRLIDARAGHAGKWSRNYNPNDFGSVNTQLNIYEKILLRRLLQTSVVKDVAVLFQLYKQYVKKTPDMLIRDQSFETIQKTYKSLESKK